ncbi:hypothetical protein ABZ413_02025 [Nocardia rhamnosiphila]|uniref:hypothetical protein n=1 Tax=Nocardia rhamnosiphila TaxID=426716 RepID=UPI003405731C
MHDSGWRAVAARIAAVSGPATCALRAHNEFVAELSVGNSRIIRVHFRIDTAKIPMRAGIGRVDFRELVFPLSTVCHRVRTVHLDVRAGGPAASPDRALGPPRVVSAQVRSYADLPQLPQIR